MARGTRRGSVGSSGREAAASPPVELDSHAQHVTAVDRDQTMHASKMNGPQNP